MEMVNPIDVSAFGRTPLRETVRIGLIPRFSDDGPAYIDEALFAQQVAKELRRQSGCEVLYPTVGATPVDAQVLLSLEMGPFKDSAGSMFVSFPGVLIGMPAWRGLSYSRDFTVHCEFPVTSGRTYPPITLPFHVDWRYSDSFVAGYNGFMWTSFGILYMLDNPDIKWHYNIIVGPKAREVTFPGLAASTAHHILKTLEPSLGE